MFRTAAVLMSLLLTQSAFAAMQYAGGPDPESELTSLIDCGAEAYNYHNVAYAKNCTFPSEEQFRSIISEFKESSAHRVAHLKELRTQLEQAIQLAKNEQAEHPNTRLALFYRSVETSVEKFVNEPGKGKGIHYLPGETELEAGIRYLSSNSPILTELASVQSELDKYDRDIKNAHDETTRQALSTARDQYLFNANVDSLYEWDFLFSSDPTQYDVDVLLATQTRTLNKSQLIDMTYEAFINDNCSGTSFIYTNEDPNEVGVDFLPSIHARFQASPDKGILSFVTDAKLIEGIMLRGDRLHIDCPGKLFGQKTLTYSQESNTVTDQADEVGSDDLGIKNAAGNMVDVIDLLKSVYEAK